MKRIPMILLVIVLVGGTGWVGWKINEAMKEQWAKRNMDPRVGRVYLQPNRSVWMQCERGALVYYEGSPQGVHGVPTAVSPQDERCKA